MSNFHNHTSHDAAADVISAVEFDAGGGFLATGDRGGRVVLFEQTPLQQQVCCFKE